MKSIKKTRVTYAKWVRQNAWSTVLNYYYYFFLGGGGGLVRNKWFIHLTSNLVDDTCTPLVFRNFHQKKLWVSGWDFQSTLLNYPKEAIAMYRHWEIRPLP